MSFNPCFVLQLPLLSSFYKPLLAISLIKSPMGRDALPPSANAPKNFRVHHPVWQLKVRCLPDLIIRLCSQGKLLAFGPIQFHFSPFSKTNAIFAPPTQGWQHQASLGTLRKCMLPSKFGQNTFYPQPFLDQVYY